MCTYSQMIRSMGFEEGYLAGLAAAEKRGEIRGEKRGEKRGEVRGVRKAAIELYLDGDVPLEKAAAKCSLPVSEFLMLVDLYRKGLF